MRAFAVLMLTARAGPAMALPQSAREPHGLRIYSPAQFGAVAETPSRIAGSREEMNQGRNTAIGPSVQQQAAVVGRTHDGGPLIEIDCVEGGGVIIAGSDPLQVTDCLDLAPDTGQAGRRQRIVTACTLPGNLGLAERSQSASN